MPPSAAQSVSADSLQDLPHPARFVHLRVQSSYSLLESTLTLRAIADACKAHGMPAVAICDRNNMFGALEISEKFAPRGIQPIIGVTLALRAQAKDTAAGSLALLARNAAGYQSLLQLVSFAHLHSTGEPTVSLEQVEAHKDGLICLSGGPEGPIDSCLARAQPAQAAELLQHLAAMFREHFYVELQRYPRAANAAAAQKVEQDLAALAYQHRLPLVATNQALFLRAEDFEAQDALRCIAQGQLMRDEARAKMSPDHGLKSPDDMCALFADVPEALQNTIEIARRVDFRPTARPPQLPKYDAPDEAAALRSQAEKGLAARLAAVPAQELAAARTDYKERLAYELKTIIAMGYAGYFLIVADFIGWAKKQNIAVGPGRGSGAGSLAAWALGITELDPLRFGLLFERFLNPARVSMPDFDIDFCQQRRDEVIAYVQQKYGADRVAQIITFGTLQARAVLRDVGRVLSLPYGQVDALCKMVPYAPPIADEDGAEAARTPRLQQAIADEPRLQEAIAADPEIKRLTEIAFKLEGLYRHASTHAAGVVVARAPLAELVPLYRDPRAALPATQFNMKWAEAAGLVKFDFLGLKTLSVLQRAGQLLAAEGSPCDWNALPLADDKSFALLGAGDTLGVFQLESGGMRDVLRQMRPDSFEDIIALVALYRPGPMDNIPLYIACKRGEKSPNLLHPTLAPVLKETYGVMIYQEQVMQIAQLLSGYSLGDADLLRRAMGKKIKAEMTKQKKGFIDGALANGVERGKAANIFDQVDKFAGYGFNKSHAAAYALVAWQTAWLKANHPLIFYAATMSFDLNDTDRLQAFCQDARRRKIAIVPPDVNQSEALFAARGAKIFYALAAIRHVGRKAMEALVAERERQGRFRSVFDFVRRTAAHLDQRSLEALIVAGACDGLESDRARLLANIAILLREAKHAADAKTSRQDSLFGEGESRLEEPVLPPAEPWDRMTRLQKEFEAIGFYVSGHPLEDYAAALAAKKLRTHAEQQERAAAQFWLAGAVLKLQERKSKRGNPYAFLSLSDMAGEYEVILFANALAEAREYLQPGSLLALHVQRARGEGDSRLQADFIRPLDAWLKLAPSKSSASAPSKEGDAEAKARAWRVRFFVEDARALSTLQTQLQACAAAEGESGASVQLVLLEGERESALRLPGLYRLEARHMQAMKTIAGLAHIAAEE